MKNLFAVSLVILSLTSFCYAGLDLASYLPHPGAASENDIQDLYNLYTQFMVGRRGFSHTPERFQLLRQNVLDILNNNADPSSTYKRAINKYAGLFNHEIVGSTIMENQECQATQTVTLIAPRNVPTSKDWRESGIVTPVKDQKTCGSCWAFAATGALESFWALYTNVSPVSLSEQQLIDCSDDLGNYGCEGGLPSRAFDYVLNQGGLNTENTYPYEAQDDICRYNKLLNGAKVFSNSVNIAQGDENSILNAVASVGPVTIAFQVTADFLTYESGIYTSTHCSQSPNAINHAALIVGYGVDSQTGMDYWIVKNSWGSSWGENGYFRIQRGVNMCGIAECASYPNLSKSSSSDLFAAFLA